MIWINLRKKRWSPWTHPSSMGIFKVLLRNEMSNVKTEDIKTNILMQNSGKFGRPTGAHADFLTLKISE